MTEQNPKPGTAEITATTIKRELDIVKISQGTQSVETRRKLPQDIPTTSNGQSEQSKQPRVVLPEELACTFKEKIGEGAFGKVFLVYDNKRQELVACKMIELKKMKDTYLNKFLPREIDITLKVRHPNIITSHSVHRVQDRIYLMMDYAERRDLEYYISRLCKGRIRESQARVWLRQIANGLEYLHEIGVAHRDIKCENILVTKNLNAKLGDFGFCRVFLNEKKKQEMSNTFCGTLGYAAPEVLKNRPYNPKCSDVWSVGVVLYKILNKNLPFGNTHTSDLKMILAKQEGKQWRFNSKFDKLLSDEVKQLIKLMLDPSPKTRITAPGIQKHAWIFMDRNLQVMKSNERQALLYGRKNQKTILRYRDLAEMIDPSIPRVKEIISNEPNYIDSVVINVQDDIIPQTVCYDD